MALDFNTAPYFDDYDAAKNYLRVLFRGGHAVQARELTQLQTALQGQISSFADNIFDDGAVVIPGGTFYEPRFSYVKIDAVYPGIDGVSGEFTGTATDIDVSTYSEWEGKVIEGVTSGVKAKIQKVVTASGIDPITFYVQYLTGGNNDAKRIADGEKIEIDVNAATPAAAAQVATTDATGYGAAFFIDSGIYYLKKCFVNVTAQTLILQKYNTYDPDTLEWSNPISGDVGFNTIEEIITPADDATLNDNAQGEPNYAAPGAHRYKINPELIYVTLESQIDNEDFTLLLRLKDGEIKKKVRDTDYSALEDTLARRTFDESGNYVINPFLITVGEHLREGDNDGLLTLSQGGENSKYYVDIQPSKGYVKGYEIETYSKTILEAPKAREYDSFNNYLLSTNYGGWIWASGTTVELPNLTELEHVILYTDSGATAIGSARIRYISSSIANVYKVYLFNISFDAGYGANDVDLIKNAGATLVLTPRVSNSTSADISFALNESTKSGLIFEFPYDQVKSTSDYTYDVIVYSNSVTVVDNTTIKVSLGSGYSPSTTEWVLNHNTDDVSIIYNSNATVNNSEITISGIPSPASSDYTFIGFATKPSGALRRVELLENQLAPINLSLQYGYATSNGTANFDNNYFWLGAANVQTLKEVVMTTDGSPPIQSVKNGGATPNGTNVTNYFTLDKNANDNYYGISKAIKSPALTIPHTAQLLFVFDQLKISTGEFISVDSYLSEPNETYGTSQDPSIESIPLHNSSRYGKTIALSNCIDFRPVVDESGFSQPTTDEYVGQYAHLATPFALGSNLIPNPIGSRFQADIEFYLSRVDKLIVDYKGTFGFLFGKSDVSPKAPKDREDAMTLYELYVPAYTRYASNIQYSMIDNRRYTMRDIGAIEKRVQKLEYYASLNALERETSEKQITDGSGNAVYKNGFLVDPFFGTNIADAGNPEFRASIDKVNKELRPAHYTNNIPLTIETGASTNSNYVIKGTQLMLDYVEEESISQPYASTSVSLNPFEVFDWTGTLELTPDSDQWKETKLKPTPTVFDQEGLYDALYDIIDESNILGTEYGEWEYNWNGATKTGKTWGKTNTKKTYGEGAGYRQHYVQTVEYNITKSRTNMVTEAKPETVETKLGDRVVDVSYAPYMRSKIIQFKATRMKPNTRVYAFFDQINVSDYCIKYTDPSFNWEDRRLEPTYILGGLLSKGPNTRTQHPNYVNGVNGGTAFVTDDNGEIAGEFMIPNNETLKFKTGTRDFILLDDPDAIKTNSETVAKTTFTSSGMIQRSESVVLSTKVPRIKTRPDIDSNVPDTATKREAGSVWNGYVETALNSVGGIINSGISGALNEVSKVGGAISKAFSGWSDIELKENIVPIQNATSLVSQLNGVHWEWKDDFLDGIGKDYGYINKSDTGLIAQDVQKVLPEAIGENEGYLTVDYQKIIALLVESNKELNDKINKLEEQISKKEKQE